MAEMKLYLRQPLIVEAMQIAPNDNMVAEKDREEQTRAVAQWLDSRGCEVVYFEKGRIEFHAPEHGPVFILEESDWVMCNDGEFRVMSAQEFDKEFSKLSIEVKHD